VSKATSSSAGSTPTLEAQYVFKDIVPAAAGLVIAAKALAAAPVRLRI
jgi:putative oxidoreductase